MSSTLAWCSPSGGPARAGTARRCPATPPVARRRTPAAGRCLPREYGGAAPPRGVWPGCGLFPRPDGGAAFRGRGACGGVDRVTFRLGPDPRRGRQRKVGPGQARAVEAMRTGGRLVVVRAQLLPQSGDLALTPHLRGQRRGCAVADEREVVGGVGGRAARLGQALVVRRAADVVVHGVQVNNSGPSEGPSSSKARNSPVNAVKRSPANALASAFAPPRPARTRRGCPPRPRGHPGPWPPPPVR